LLLSALTLDPEGTKINLAGAGLADATAASGFYSKVDNSDIAGDNYLTLASSTLSATLDLDDISVGVLTTALENVSFLRAQNGGTGSRLNFAYEALAQQKTNMRAALGRMVDVDVAEESTNLAKYNVLSQAAASMIAQANSTSELALILLR
jgi:flagellin